MRQREQEEKDIERRVRLEERVRDRIREERRTGAADKRRRREDDHDYNQQYNGYNHDHHRY